MRTPSPAPQSHVVPEFEQWRRAPGSLLSLDTNLQEDRASLTLIPWPSLAPRTRRGFAITLCSSGSSLPGWTFPRVREVRVRMQGPEGGPSLEGQPEVGVRWNSGPGQRKRRLYYNTARTAPQQSCRATASAWGAGSQARPSRLTLPCPLLPAWGRSPPAQPLPGEIPAPGEATRFSGRKGSGLHAGLRPGYILGSVGLGARGPVTLREAARGGAQGTISAGGPGPRALGRTGSCPAAGPHLRLTWAPRPAGFEERGRAQAGGPARSRL